MASYAEINLMAGTTAIGLSDRLGAMVVFPPGHDVVAGLHDLMTLVACVAAIARDHCVAASAGRLWACSVRSVIAPKCLSVIGRALGGWHVRAGRQGPQACALGVVAGLAVTHSLHRGDPTLVIVATHTDLHYVACIAAFLLCIRLCCRGVAGNAADTTTFAIGPMGTVAKVQITRHQGPLATLGASSVVTLSAVLHGRAARRRGLTGMAARTGGVCWRW